MENWLNWKEVTSQEKVQLHKEPTGDGVQIPLMALKGERVAVQAALCCTAEYQKYARIEASLAVNEPDGTSVNEWVELYHVANVPCSYPCHFERADDDYIGTEPGLYPDLLEEIPDYGLRLSCGNWEAVWAEICVPKTAEAGQYLLTISVYEKTNDGSEAAVEPLAVIERQLTVLPAVLPDQTVPHIQWFHYDGLMNYYGVEAFSEEFWRITENFVRTAVEHGINMLLTPIFTPPLDTAIGGERRTIQLVDVCVTDDGRYTFDFEKLERFVALCRRAGVRYYEISHLFTQWGAKFAPKVMGHRGSFAAPEERIFGWETEGTGEAYGSFLHALLPELRAKLKELGILQDCYFHISDEPGIQQMENYRKAYELVKEELADCKRMDALSDYEFYKSGLVQVPVCATNHLSPFLVNRPEELWCYYCTGQYEKTSNSFIAMPGYRTRVLGAQMYKLQIDGFLHWGYNFYNTQYSLQAIDPYRSTDAGGAFPAGDPFLVYPKADGTAAASIRLKYMDQAFQDLAAFRLLEQLTDRETVLSLIDPKGSLAAEQYEKGCTAMLRLRADVNTAIARLVSDKQLR